MKTTRQLKSSRKNNFFMKLNQKLSFIGLLFYLLFSALAFRIPPGTEQTADVEAKALSSPYALLLFALGFFLPGFAMSMGWASQRRAEKNFTRRVLFVIGGTALYSLAMLAGIDDTLGLFTWMCLSSCGLLLLHHYLLEPLQPLPRKLFIGLGAAAFSMIPIVLALSWFRIESPLLVWIGFLSFPLWGKLMGKVAE